MTVKIVPMVSPGLWEIEPLCISTILRQIASPKPAPESDSCLVPRENRLSLSSGGIPTPIRVGG